MPEKMPITRIVLILVLFVVALLAIGAFELWQFRSKIAEKFTLDPRVQTLIESQRAGDFRSAADQAREIQNDPNSTSNVKAQAVLNALGASYRLTGDISARVEDIQKLKQIVLDPSVSTQNRVTALNDIAGAYQFSGGNSTVFAEVFKDKPFSDFYATSTNADQTARLSARRIFEWSYGLEPTSLAAISISRWYSEQQAFNPKAASSTIDAYYTLAEEYLNKADAAAVEEAKLDPNYTNSTRYLIYRYWKAVIFGRLAGAKGERYQNGYRATYDEFITFAQGFKNPLASEYVLYSRLYYSVKLTRDNDMTGAKKQLDLLAAEMNAVSNPSTNVFLRFLKTEYTERPNGLTWRNMVLRGYKISPDFEAAVQRVVQSPSN